MIFLIVRFFLCFLLFFSRENKTCISCISSASQKIHMTCQALFSPKNNNNNNNNKKKSKSAAVVIIKHLCDTHGITRK